MMSVWNDLKKKKFDTLEGNIKTDVLIIGGGICGILCAKLLKDAGVIVVKSNYQSAKLASAMMNELDRR